MELISPVDGVLEKEFANRPGIIGVQVKSSAPGGVMPLVEIKIAVGAQVISVRPEMIVNDIQDYTQPEVVSAIKMKRCLRSI